MVDRNNLNIIVQYISNNSFSGLIRGEKGIDRALIPKFLYSILRPELPMEAISPFIIPDLLELLSIEHGSLEMKFVLFNDVVIDRPISFSLIHARLSFVLEGGTINVCSPGETNQGELVSITD